MHKIFITKLDLPTLYKFLKPKLENTGIGVDLKQDDPQRYNTVDIRIFDDVDATSFRALRDALIELCSDQA